MLALTLYPEWIPSFPILGKDVENRCWWQARAQATLLALHAGTRWGGRSARAARWDAIQAVSAFARNAGAADVTIHRYQRAALGQLEGWPRDLEGCVKVVVEFSGVVLAADPAARGLRWAMRDATHHWIVARVLELPEPVRVTEPGFHAGLWRLPPRAEEAIKTQVQAVFG